MVQKAHILAACAILLMAGCVLFVDDRSDYSTTCHFNGDGRNACGLCVATSCQAAVNGCCGLPSCASAMTELDQCGGGGDCTALMNEATSFSAERKSLGQCVKDHCAPLCATTGDGGAIPPPGGASVSCNNDSVGGGCTCVGEISQVPSSGTCSAAALGVPDANALCCADTNFPTTLGSVCQCYHLECDTPTAGTCACGQDVTDGTDGTTCPKVGAGACCLSQTTARCFCSSTPSCGSGFIDMGSTCSPAALSCPKGKQHVTACR